MYASTLHGHLFRTALVGALAASPACSSSDGGSSAGGASARSDVSATSVDAQSSTGAGGAGGGSNIPPGPRKSIGEFANCDGVTDDWQGVTNAFAAAKGGAFILIVDCPLKMHIGSDIEHPIFVDNDTTVAFLGEGKLTLDNLFVPAFVVANTTKVDFIDWNVEWDGSMPVDEHIGSYERGGVTVSDPGGNGSGHFNDLILKPWLEQNRGIVFDQSQGYVSSQWQGSVNTGALFFMIGDTSDVKVSGMKLYAPRDAGVDHFIPFAFMLGQNFKSNETVTGATPFTSDYREVPHDITFSNISLDGTYMGFQGNTHDAVFEHIRSNRYGDLQDAEGNNVGGVGKYFPPPHLFYLNYNYDADAASLANRNIEISDVVDSGVRLGTARDKGGSDSISGYALSLKLGCIDCSVDGYTTYRPDGFMDVLTSDGLKVSNVTATYDSAFINDVFPGWRWPISPYENVTFDHVTMADTSPTTGRPPMSGANGENIVFHDVRISVNDYTSSSEIVPKITGQGIDSEIDFSIASDASKLVAATSLSVGFTLKALPAVVSAGGSTSLIWTSTTATTCVASGGWSGTLAPSGAKTLVIPSAGTTNFVLTCNNATDTATATMAVVAE